MAYVRLGNPIWSCQYLLHGRGRLFARAGVYAALVVGLIIFFHKMAGPGQQIATTARTALGIVSWAQAVILILLGCAAISKAFQRDYATKMVESHRISPMSSFTVVMGYVFGPTMQVLMSYAVGVVIGLFLANFAGRSTSAWLLGNFFLLIVAVSIWCLAVFVAVGSGKPGNLTALVVVGSMLSPLFIMFVPGLALMMGAYGVGHSQSYMFGGQTSAEGLGLALVVATLMMVFWAVAAARYHRKPHLPPLSVPAALVLVGLVLIVSLTSSFVHAELIAGPFTEVMSADDPASMSLFAVCLVTVLLVGHLPAASAVRMRRRHILGARPRSRWDECSPLLATAMSLVLVFTILAAVIGLGRPSGMVAGFNLEAFGVIHLSLALAFWTVTSAMRFSRFASGKNVVAAIAVVLLWAGPPLVDYTRVALSGYPSSIAGDYSLLLGCSPVFTIIGACVGLGYPLWSGLGVQAVIAVLAHLLGDRAERLLVARRRSMLEEEGGVLSPDGGHAG